MPQPKPTHPDGTRMRWQGQTYKMTGGQWVPEVAASVDPVEEASYNKVRGEELDAVYRAGMLGRQFLNSGKAGQARALLDRTDTGLWAGPRMAVGKALPRAVTDSVTFIPDKDEVDAFDRLSGLSGDFALDKAALLKGPISEKELKFLRQMVLSVGNTEPSNRMFIDATEWAARRASEYARQRRRWTSVRPADRPVEGKRWATFDDWWEEYAREHIPAPADFRAYVDSDGRVRPSQSAATTRPKREIEYTYDANGNLVRR